LEEDINFCYEHFFATVYSLGVRVQKLSFLASY